MRFRLALAASAAALLGAAGCSTVASGERGQSPVGFGATTDASTMPSEQPSESTAAETFTRASEESGTDAARLNGGAPGVPEQSGASVDDVLRLGAVAVWIDEPTVFALSLPASPDCWPSAAQPVASDGGVVVAFERDGTCEVADAARTYTLTVPEGVDASGGLAVSVVGLERDVALTLPAS